MHATAPIREVPDRENCYPFHNRDRERMAYWNRAIQESGCLSEEFLDAVEGGRIRELALPLPG